MIREQRAAIYVRDGLVSARWGEMRNEQLIELCCQYCAARGYQLCENYIYQVDGKPLYSDTPS